MLKQCWRFAPKGLFILSVLLVTYGYGVYSTQHRKFPYPFIQRAQLAWNALQTVFSGDDNGIGDDPLAAPRNPAPLRGPVTLHRTGAEDLEWILVNGARDDFERVPHQMLARVIDREGTTRHAWPYDLSMWDDLKRVRTVPGKSDVHPAGIHVDADGNLLVNFHGKNCWPYGVGMAKLNHDGKTLWNKELLTHHWFTVTDKGQIVVPAIRIVESPWALGDTFAAIHSAKKEILEDLILVLDPDGNILEEYSLLKILAESQMLGLVVDLAERNDAKPPGMNIDLLAWDPTHLNDVRLVTASQAQFHPSLKEGDFLVSMRSLNSVGIIDRETKRFKWMAAGRTLRQHSPRFWNGGILVFDNWGGVRETGGSRLVRIDFDQRVLPETVFPRPAFPTSEPFLSTLQGHIDLHPDGRRALVASSYQGILWEVDLTTGEILWEYVAISAADPLQRTRITCAKYCLNPSFPMNSTESAEASR